MAIIAAFSQGATKTYTKSVYQYDKGQRLMIVGVPLPSTFEVHFSINEEGGIGTAHEATPEYGVLIPDEYLATGEYIYAWIYVNGEDDEERAAAYSIVIPVIKRSSFVPVSFGQGMKGFDLDEDHTLVVVPK